MPSNNKGLAIVALILAMATGSASEAQPRKSSAAPRGDIVSDVPMPLDAPYIVEGVTHSPSDPVYYDEVGYGGLTDSPSKGDRTANDEAFTPSAVTAAHKTLPLPSYIEVTALDSGKTILVRVNDRGPMRNDQLIALSPGAAEQLGVSGSAIPVRVRRVNPPEQERAVLRTQGRAAERLETPVGLLKMLRAKLPASRPAVVPVSSAKPKVAAATVKPAQPIHPGADFDKPAPRAAAKITPATTPKPIKTASGATPARKGGYVVQVGAFASQARAEALARSIGARSEPHGNLWRVRFGPYPTQQAAQAGVRAAAAKGFENVRITANDAQ